jgi:hypothetical protein
MEDKHLLEKKSRPFAERLRIATLKFAAIAFVVQFLIIVLIEVTGLWAIPGLQYLFLLNLIVTFKHQTNMTALIIMLFNIFVFSSVYALAYYEKEVRAQKDEK